MEELLIKKVKEREFLFDIKSPNYKDRNMRQEAWEEIGRDLKMKPEVVKEKWLKLRRCFTNALNRRGCKKSGEAAKKIQSWKFGKQMTFLLPHLDPRKTHPSTEESGDYEHEEDQEQQEHDIEFEDVKNIHIMDDMEDTENISQKSEMIHQENTPRNIHTIQYLEKDESEKRQTENGGNTTNEIVRLLKENSTLRHMTYQENPKPTEKPNFNELDESDMFFLSMSKMAKRLPLVAQANIKLLLSQAVLQAEIANAGKQSVNDVTNISTNMMLGMDFQPSSGTGQ